MRGPAVLARGLAHRAWLARWRLLEAAAGVGRHVAPGSVALTFDDGPSPASTGRVLDVLAALDVRATFFCVGRSARTHPELVRRMRAEGHAVGSHSQSHPDPAATRLLVLAREYREGRQAVATALGGDTPLFRPPHGHLRGASAVLVRRQGLSPWLWSVDPQDWRPGVSCDHVASVAGAAGSGDVVLLHDWVEQPEAPEALDRSATIDALPVIVERIRARGLTLTALLP